jgi:MoaA/NifB/PqqE/SkfB family radical SAM enzyme
MRRLYRERVLETLRRGEVLRLVRLAGRWSAVLAGPLLGRPLAGPILGTVVTNYSCNLRCRMCDLPLRVGRHADRGLREMTTPEMLGVIDDFAALGTIGLGFTGGEPFLRADLFDLLERSRRGGMVTHLNTNGSLLDDAAAARLVASRVDSVNVSLDGADETTHDEIRARRGSFEEVLSAIGRLRDARRAAGASVPRIKLVCVLGRRNLDQAERLVEMRRRLGADAVDFLPVHDFDDPGSERHESLLAPFAPEEASRALAVARRLTELVASEPIENSRGHLALFPRALRGEPSPIRCHAGFNSLVVDGYGRIFPCVPWSNAERAVGDVRRTPLRRFWRSGEYARRRREVRRCRDCYLNCQTELNLMFRLRAPRLPREDRSASRRSGSA